MQRKMKFHMFIRDVVIWSYVHMFIYALFHTADVRWIDPPKRFGLGTKPSICGFFSLLRNNFT